MFERLKSAEQADVGEVGLLDVGAGEQIIDGGVERVGELDERIGGRGVEPTLILVDLLEPRADDEGELLLRPVSGLAQCNPRADRLLVWMDSKTSESATKFPTAPDMCHSHSGSLIR